MSRKRQRARRTFDPAALTHAQRVELLCSIERRKARLEALQARVLAAMAADPHPTLDRAEACAKEWVREDVACALRIRSAEATGRLHDATDLVDRLPATLALLAAGDISMGHASRLITAVRGLSDAQTWAIEHDTLERAAVQTPTQFRRTLRRAVTAADPRSAETRYHDALTQRRVCRSAAPDGMAEVWTLLSAEDAARVWAAVGDTATREAYAARAAGITDHRTADQRRADTLVALLDHAAARHDSAARREDKPVKQRPGDSPSEPVASEAVASDPDLRPAWRRVRSRPAVLVTVALSTLLGLDEQPGELDGHGPVHAVLARRIAADPTGTWRRLVTDPTGRLIDYGRTTYRPPAALDDHVRAREQTCRFPTCTRTAWSGAELDHIHDWANGGHTQADNLQPLCVRHHHTKHDATWQVTRGRDGTTTWTSPTGHQYSKPPETLPTDTTMNRLWTDPSNSHGSDPPAARGSDSPSQKPDDAGAFADPDVTSDIDPPPF